MWTYLHSYEYSLRLNELLIFVCELVLLFQTFSRERDTCSVISFNCEKFARIDWNLTFTVTSINDMVIKSLFSSSWYKCGGRRVILWIFSDLVSWKIKIRTFTEQLTWRYPGAVACGTIWKPPPNKSVASRGAQPVKNAFF